MPELAEVSRGELLSAKTACEFLLHVGIVSGAMASGLQELHEEITAELETR
jgi:hypothetical protein